jgi:hypothetical protein
MLRFAYFFSKNNKKVADRSVSNFFIYFLNLRFKPFLATSLMTLLRKPGS